MKKTMILLLLFFSSFQMNTGLTQAVVMEEDSSIQDRNAPQIESYSSGRGSYRSPSGSFSGGARGGSYTTGPRSPSSNVTRNPQYQQPYQPANRFGGFFGGLATGALIGHFLNPFSGLGQGYGMGGVSILGILFWILIIYLAYKFFKRLRSK
ncbi:hypothetical protein ACFQZT_04225 [Paenibacillus sp. GCM10027628]|uniref:hypothetical protein n=1 Tax=Paenibacillus sp. GCM10027628 TaxID=3273413 RepID=UPI00364594C4